MTPAAAGEHPAQALAADRHARLQAAMDAGGIDGVLLSRPAHGTLVSGARRVQVAGSGGGAPWVVAVRGAPAPHVFTPDPDGAPGWMPRTHVHPLRWDPAALVREIVALLGGGVRAVAYDVLSVAMLGRVEAALPGVRLEDAAPLLAAARVPKPPAEVALLAAAAEKAARAVGAAGRALVAGARPADLAAAALRQMAAEGVGFPLADVGVAVLAPGAGAPFLREPARPFARGDHVAVDLALADGGIAARCVRTFLCGAAPDAAATALASRWREAMAALAAAGRAGASIDRLREAAGVQGLVAAGLLVHGVGIGIEPPFVDLAGGAPRAPGAPLAAGAALVLAPCVHDERDGLWASETVVVGAGGAARIGPPWGGWESG